MAGPKPQDSYDSVNSVAPEVGSGNDYQQISSPASAFGGQVGEAEQKLGATGEAVTDKASDLAAHFQELYNDSTARDGVTNASKALSDAELEFKQNKGNNAITAYKTFQDKVSSIQEQYAGSMPNAQAQKMFKDQFSSESRGAIFRSGAYVADQTEAAQISSLNSAIANNVNQFAMNADNPTRSTYINKIQDQALQYAHTAGLDVDKADEMVSKNVGLAYSAGIKSLMTTNPDQAKALFDEGVNGSFQTDHGPVPYISAESRAQIEGEMNGELRRQEGEALQTSRMYASTGDNYDKDSLVKAMKNVGRGDDYINAELHHLDSVQDSFGSVGQRYTIEKALQDDTERAQKGLPVLGVYDQASVAKAYPKNPEKQQDVLNEVNDLHAVAGFVSGMSTRTPDQIVQQLQSYKPKASTGNSTDGAINWTIDHEGGFVSNDSGKGPTNFGINQEANPDVDVKSLTRDQAADIIKAKYFDPIGADKMSPQMAMVAGDTAVNLGVNKAKLLIAESGSDPQKLIDLRRAEYNRLAANDPQRYGADLPGWNARLDQLQQSLPNADMSGRFTEQSRLYDKMQKAATNYLKELADDPSGKVTSTDPNLTNLLNAGMKDPTKLGAFIDASVTRQEAVGVPEANRTALPYAVAQKLTANIMANPETSPATINQLKQQTGDHWPSVYKSLVTQGDLPPYMQSVAQLGEDPSTERDASLLARWKGEDTKGKTDADLVGAENEKKIKDSIDSSLNVTSFTQSLYHSGASKDQVDGVKNSIASLACAKSFYDRDPNATENAIKSFTAKYEFMPNGGARVPSKVMDAVSQNAQAMIGSLEAQAVPPAAYTTGNHGLVKPDDYFNAVKAAPTWITTPNETGLWLKDPWDRLVRDKDGKPLYVPFSATAPAPKPESQNYGQPANFLDFQ